MKTFLILCFLVMAQLTSAQTIVQTIRGRVVDIDSKQPLPGATIILLNSDPLIGVTSNIDGEYIISNVPIGRQSITVSFIGYHPLSKTNILLQSGKESIVDVELTEKLESLSDIEIRAYKHNGQALNEMAPVSARSFSKEQTERFAGSLGDPARMVGNYAGVVMQNDSRNDIIIRGNSPLGVIWRMDDVEIPNPNHFGSMGTTGGPVSMINNNLLSQSDFFTGAFPAEFGNGISGAFDLRLRSGNNQQTEFTGQIGFNGFEFGAEGPFSPNSKASYMVFGRYSTLALMHTIGFGTGTGSAIPYYKDLTFKIDLPTKKLGKFSLFGIYGDSDIDLGSDLNDTSATSYNFSDQRTVFGSNMAVVGLSHLIFLNSKTRIKTTLSGQLAGDETSLDRYKLEEDRSEAFYRGNNRHDRYAFASYLKSKINSKNILSVGFFLTQNRLDYSDSIFVKENQRFVTLHDVDASYTIFRPYAQYVYKLTDQMSFFGGMNFLANTINHSFSLEPRAGMEWAISPVQSVTIGFGKHSQMQPASVYYLQYEDTIQNRYLETNKELGLTKADHYVLGYNYQFSEQTRIKAEVYYQSIYDVPVSPGFPEFSMLNAGEFFNIPATDSLINTGKGENYGLEVTFEKALSDGYYALLTTSIFNSGYRGYDNLWRNTAFNSNYVINLLAGYEIKIRNNMFLTLDTRTVYSGGKRYIPVDLDASILNEYISYNFQFSYESQFADYFRTDFRIGFKLNGKRLNQEWAVDLQNLTGHQAPFQQAFDSNRKEIYYSYQQGFYPMFLYRIQF